MTIHTQHTHADQKQEFLSNLHRMHTTVLGEERIRRNLGLAAADVVGWCAEQSRLPGSCIVRRGKNWYICTGACEITVNAHSYTVITAHRLKADG